MRQAGLLIPNEADSFNERLERNTVKERPAKTNVFLGDWIQASEQWHQRLHTQMGKQTSLKQSCEIKKKKKLKNNETSPGQGTRGYVGGESVPRVAVIYYLKCPVFWLFKMQTSFAHISIPLRNSGGSLNIMRPNKCWVDTKVLALPLEMIKGYVALA